MVHRANQQSNESIAHTLSVLNQGAGAAGSDFSKRSMVTWTPDETRKALEVVGVTAYQMKCLETRGILEGGSNLKLYMHHLGDPAQLMLNGPIEDLTIPQYFELLSKFEFAYSQPVAVPHKPDTSGACGKQTETGVAMEQHFQHRFSGLDGLKDLGKVRCETREQYRLRIDEIKSDLSNYLETMKFESIADKNALENLAVAHGLDLNSPTKYSKNKQAAQIPADQLPKTKTKGTEEFKESGTKPLPAKPMDLLDVFMSNQAKQVPHPAKQVPHPAKQPSSLTYAGTVLYAAFDEEFARIDALKAAGVPAEQYAADFDVAMKALRDQIADYKKFALSQADLGALKQMEASRSVTGHVASVGEAKAP